MDTLALIIIGIIISLVTSAKKKSQREAEKAKKAVFPVPAKKAEPVTLDTAWEVPRMETVFPAAPVIGTEGTDACHDYMLPQQPVPAAKAIDPPHIPVPVMGTEGLDTCHEYMLAETPAAQKAIPEESGLSPEEARDLMRGIILSEIMARPHQRFAGRRH